MRNYFPSISVSIPTCNSSRSLKQLLNSLVPQLNKNDEIFVVDDNSRKDELDKIESLSSYYGARFLRLEDPKNDLESFGRRSHARNLATHYSSKDVITYLDSDMILPPHYLNLIRSYFYIDDSIMIKGARPSISIADQMNGEDWCLIKASTPPKQPPFPEYKSESNICNILSLYLFYDDFSRRTFIFLMAGLLESFSPWKSWKKKSALDYSFRWDWCASNNLSVSLKAVKKAGFWDENFFGWGEEDMDFAYRLFKSGICPVFPSSDKLWAYHLDHPINSLKNRVELKRNARYLVKKFPKLLNVRAQAYIMHGLDVDIKNGIIS